MAPLKKKIKADKPSRKQALPPDIVTDAEKLSTHLSRHLYSKECAPHQVLKAGHSTLSLCSSIFNLFS